MTAPPDLKFTATHEWVRVESDGTLTAGITDFAQDQLGDIVYVEFPKVGSRYAEGAPCGVIESVKAVSDLYMPVAGVITAVDEALGKTPERVNADAYGAWMFKLKPDDPSSAGRLMDAATYDRHAHSA
ncbi:MAG: glycine cleavage system protein GcvH [SAR324 cluster bacterium]